MPPSMRAVADTSVIVAAALQSSPSHRTASDALVAANAAAAGHAWIESFSVLTRLPRDFRLTASEAATVLRSLIPEVRPLSEQEFADFISWLPSSSVSGGAVYDALVGWVARVTELPLITRDERAVPTYRAVGIEVLFVGD